MSTITTRTAKGSALTFAEMDANLTNLNTDKIEAATAATLTNKTVNLASNTLTGTAAQFDTACSDGNFVYEADVGVSVQAYSANLDEYAAVNPTAAGLALLDDADDAAQRATLGLVIGTDVQAYDADTTKNDVANAFTAMQKWAKGADIASANALVLGTDGNYFDVTGTTAILSIGTVGAGTWIKLHFDGALTLTHHATDLILPGGANITTAAGDEIEIVEYATGDWRMVGGVKADGTAWVAASGGITLGVPVATTSGTAIDFTGIPAGTKRISINFTGVSTNGTSDLVVQLGDAGGIEATGYLGMCSSHGGGTTAQFSASFIIRVAVAASNLSNGSIILTLENSSTNTWSAISIIAASEAVTMSFGAGSKALSATLDRVRITTAGGANTFDAGEINITYE